MPGRGQLDRGRGRQDPLRDLVEPDRERARPRGASQVWLGANRAPPRTRIGGARAGARRSRASASASEERGRERGRAPPRGRGRSRPARPRKNEPIACRISTVVVMVPLLWEGPRAGCIASGGPGRAAARSGRVSRAAAAAPRGEPRHSRPRRTGRSLRDHAGLRRASRTSAGGEIPLLELDLLPGPVRLEHASPTPCASPGGRRGRTEIVVPSPRSRSLMPSSAADELLRVEVRARARRSPSARICADDPALEGEEARGAHPARAGAIASWNRDDAGRARGRQRDDLRHDDALRVAAARARRAPPRARSCPPADTFVTRSASPASRSVRTNAAAAL